MAGTTGSEKWGQYGGRKGSKIKASTKANRRKAEKWNPGMETPF